ncbi:MAG: hypothetical protein EAZ92_12025 [Candidatus Kapaibacterium sp.]|nr:MAG: hypothetical protein EAZ92_12025 [Candidatus Kapabacteria bacterium]
MAQNKSSASRKNNPPISRVQSAQAAKSPPNPASFSIPLWSALLIFLGATLVFFRAQLFGDAYFWEDFTEYVYPAQSFAAQYLRGGQLPFWNPFSFSGMPFLADVAVGFFYPPNMLMAAFVENGKLPVLALELLIIAHFLLAQCTMYALMRSLKVSDAGSLIAALSYGFSGIMVHHVFHPMMIAHFAWFPLAFLHFRQALWNDEAPSRRFLNSLVSGIVLGVMMLSGHPQTTLYLVLFLFFYTLWVVVMRRTELLKKPLELLQTGIAAALPILVGAGLFAIQLLHSQEFSAYSERNAMTFERASQGSMLPVQLLSAFVPKMYGGLTPPANADDGTPQFSLDGTQSYDYWETAFYAGVPAVMLAMFAFVAAFAKNSSPSPKTSNDEAFERLPLFLFLAMFFGAFFALGSNGTLFPLFFKIPLFDRFRIPARMIAFATLAISIGAGLGFDALFRRTAIGMENVGVKHLALGFGIGLLLCCLAVTAAQAGTGGGLAILFAVSTILCAALAWRNMLHPLMICAILALCTLIDTNNAGAGFNANRQHPLDDYTQAETRLAVFRADFTQPESLTRISVRERGVMVAPRNFGLLFPIMMYEGYAPLLVERRLPPAPTADKTYDLINLGYQIAIDTAQQTVSLRERPNKYAHARMLYSAVQTSTDEASTKKVLVAGKIDFDNQVSIEKPLPFSLSGDSAKNIAHTIRCENYSANSMTYRVETAQNGLLLLAEIWYPAWKASIDGQSTEILRVNYSMRGIAVPKGTHTITLRYDSDAFRLGAWISLATLIFACVGIVVLVVKRPASQAHAAE